MAKSNRNEEGVEVDFEVEEEFPKYGNDDRVYYLGVELVTKFSNEPKKHPIYRDAKHTLSVLTYEVEQIFWNIIFDIKDIIAMESVVSLISYKCILRND
jgi:hypothetical protein